QHGSVCLPPWRVLRDASRLWPGNELSEGRSGRSRALSRPAPTNVDGDPLRGDSKGVWIATDLGLVKVHLRHLAQRRAGWTSQPITATDKPLAILTGRTTR